jgi:lysophospholipase L1-like esterase
MLTQSTEKDIHGDGSRTLMLIFFGANDATAPDYHLHVPVDEYGENLRRMVRKCQEVMPGITIVLVTPPPIDEPKLMEYAARNRPLR